MRRFIFSQASPAAGAASRSTNAYVSATSSSSSSQTSPPPPSASTPPSTSTPSSSENATASRSVRRSRSPAARRPQRGIPSCCGPCRRRHHSHRRLFTPTRRVVRRRPGRARGRGARRANGRLLGSTSARHTLVRSLESRIGPKRGFGLTPGELLTISKTNSYPKSEKPPARKSFSNPNL